MYAKGGSQNFLIKKNLNFILSLKKKDLKINLFRVRGLVTIKDSFSNIPTDVQKTHEISTEYVKERSHVVFFFFLRV